MEVLRILILDDEAVFRNELADFFTELSYIPFSAATPSEAFRILQEENIDIALVDIVLPEMSGLEVLNRIRNLNPHVACIAITGHGDMNTVISSMRAGAADFLSKPFSLFDLRQSIERTRRFVELEDRLKKTEINYKLISADLKERIGVEIVGVSPAMKKVISLASKVAETDSTSVLITGESGTGKELIARGIHALSSRSNNFFHSVNCSAIPETLFESEFFGHKKGAFTGAIESTTGWFEISHHGTLFLDEVAELPLPMQAKFLRVLDDKVISKIGAKHEISLDLRIIAATNQNIQAMVDSKKFRVDLYHRLNSFTIHIPPLRERREDIPELINYYVKHFAAKLGKNIFEVDEKVHNKLYNYEFPGNVRELKNMIERAMIVCDGSVLQLKHLCKLKGSANGNGDQLVINGDYDLEKIEKEVITKALHHCGFNKSKAARLLNISRQALDRKLEKFEIREETRFLS